MHQRAFTLLEVLLVVLILGLITALTFPNLAGELHRRSLEESARRLRSLVTMTHARAMQDGIRYRVSFPGTPDPQDTHADKKVEVAASTEQPTVSREADPLQNPDQFSDFAWEWLGDDVLQQGTRCVAVLPGQPSFEITGQNPIAGPSPQEGTEATFVPLTFKPDGTCDWVTFVLTDLPPDVEIKSSHVGRILNVIVDGRTGETWIQRALRTEEVELMREEGASPILHQDFTDPMVITEDNILQVHMGQGGSPRTGRRSISR
jgi:prepilin-type N-terminal cleavage/methylation domain-containing protein